MSEREATVLRNAIIGWFENSMYSYTGLKDENFIKMVCEKIGISTAEYHSLILEEISDDDIWHCSYAVDDLPAMWVNGLDLAITKDFSMTINNGSGILHLTPAMLKGIKSAMTKSSAKTHLILSNNSECDDLSIYRYEGSKKDAYRHMQAMVMATVANADEDEVFSVDMNLSDMTAYIQRSDSHEDFRIVSLDDVTDVMYADGVADANLDTIPYDVTWDEKDLKA